MNRISSEALPSQDSPFTSLEGKLLVANPHWQDENFQQAVCMVVHHSRQGAVGILLNREFDLDAKGLWQQLSGGKYELQADLLHLGGPQSGPVVALHSNGALGEFQASEGVYLAAEIENLQNLLQATLDAPAQSLQRDLKIIVGQADWESGDLEEQMRRGCWLALEPSAGIVFEDQAWMWPKALNEVGNNFVTAITGALPISDPSLN